MTDIQYAKDYGYPPAAPFWIVYAEEAPRIDRVTQTEPSRQAAEAAAARLAIAFPGHEFHICCVMATISTSPVVVGTKFNPDRKADPEPEPEDFAEVPVEPQIEPAPVAAAPEFTEAGDSDESLTSQEPI